MGGKKKGGAKKGKKGDDDGEIDQTVLQGMLAASVAALKSRLVLEQERRDNARKKMELLEEEDTDLDGEMGKQKEITRSTVSKMTMVYRQMETHFNEQIVKAETDVNQQESEKKTLRDDINRIIKEKDEMVQQKEEEIFKLKERIDTMSGDFAQMLKTALEKMQERIDDANHDYEGDQPQLAGGEGGGLGHAAAQMAASLEGAARMDQ